MSVYVTLRDSAPPVKRRGWMRVFFGGLLLWVASLFVTLLTAGRQLGARGEGRTGRD